MNVDMLDCENDAPTCKYQQHCSYTLLLIPLKIQKILYNHSVKNSTTYKPKMKAGDVWMTQKVSRPSLLDDPDDGYHIRTSAWCLIYLKPRMLRLLDGNNHMSLCECCTIVFSQPRVSSVSWSYCNSLSRLVNLVNEYALTKFFTVYCWLNSQLIWQGPICVYVSKSWD